MAETKQRIRKLELLAPAKNLECGIAAIDHGADAVYIGAPLHGARAAASNTIEDIDKLCQYAHKFGCKVHVTVNTIIYQDELQETLEMIRQLDDIGVDALLLQDMGLLWEIRANGLWSRELHASTQCDTRSPEKAEWLSTIGFNRIVLARELSLEEIKAIHERIPYTDIEVFVHGALCVSYSGVCYASQYCFGRSANRGECAQFCRMKFDLLDSDGKEIEHQRYLLSLKDLCQIGHLKELADAGATSFKIEGRLKDIDYVKNVVAAYSRKLDEICREEPDRYCRPTYHQIDLHFEPNLKKTFNRGFTNYFLKGRQPDVASFDTPKAMGEFVGKVKEIRGTLSFNVSSLHSFSNGDGLCFINDQHELEGFRVNRVEGNRLYPFRMPDNLRPGMSLYRNYDRDFSQQLAGKSAERKIPLYMEVYRLSDNPSHGIHDGVLIKAHLLRDEEPLTTTVFSVDVSYDIKLEKAKKPQGENICVQLGKLGETQYRCDHFDLMGDVEEYFIPNSILTMLRRRVVTELDKTIQTYFVDRGLQYGRERMAIYAPYKLDQVGEHKMPFEKFFWQPEYAHWGYLYNIANFPATEFYEKHGQSFFWPAFEIGGEDEWPVSWTAQSKEEYEAALAKEPEQRKHPKYAVDDEGELLLMQCRHCIRYSLGYCVKRGGKKPTWREPLYLRLGDGRKFRLEFACKQCQMNVFAIGN